MDRYCKMTVNLTQLKLSQASSCLFVRDGFIRVRDYCVHKSNIQLELFLTAIACLLQLIISIRISFKCFVISLKLYLTLALLAESRRKIQEYSWT
jgi:hypothetical protein